MSTPVIRTSRDEPAMNTQPIAPPRYSHHSLGRLLGQPANEECTTVAITSTVVPTTKLMNVALSALDATTRT